MRTGPHEIASSDTDPAIMPDRHHGEYTIRRTGRASILKAVAAVLAVVVGAVLFYQPRWVLLRISGRSRRIAWFRETDARLMALTIDDAPDAEGTRRILDVLARHGARATFFLLAHNIAGNEELMHRLLAEGHEIGNHIL